MEKSSAIRKEPDPDLDKKCSLLGSNPADADDGGSGWIAEGYSP